MRVVVDMNVLISATIKPNSPLAQADMHLMPIRLSRFTVLLVFGCMNWLCVK